MIDFSKDFEEYLNLYLDNRLEPEIAGQFEKFLSENPEKAEDLAAFDKIDSAAKSQTLPELPEGYWEGLHKRIDTQVAKIESGKSGYAVRVKKYLREHLFSFVPAARIASITLAILTVALISRNFIGDFHVTDLVEEKPAITSGKMAAPSPQQLTEPVMDEGESTSVDSDSMISGLTKSADSLQDLEEKSAAITDKKKLPTVEDKIAEQEKKGGESVAEKQIVTAKEAPLKYEKTAKSDFNDLASNARIADSIGKALTQGEYETTSAKKKQVGGDPWSGDRIDTMAISQPNSAGVITHHPEITLDEAQLVPQSVNVHEDEAKMEPQSVGVLKEDAVQGKASIAEIISDELHAVEDSGLKIRGGRKSELSATEARPGEAEMDSTLYLLDEPEVARNADDLRLEDFPILSWDAQNIEKKPNQSKSIYSARPQTGETESSLFMSQPEIFKHELDSVMELYNAEYDPGFKIDYFREVVERAFELAKFETTEDNLRYFKKLLNQALILGIVTPAKYEEYSNSLPLFDRLK